MNEGCTSNSTVNAIEMLGDAIIRHRAKNIIVAGHHPLLSHGEYGKGIGLSRQHLNNPRYKAVRKGILDALSKGQKVTYVKFVCDF